MPSKSSTYAAERAFLCGLVNEPERFPGIAADVPEEAFSDSSHRCVFAVLLASWRLHRRLDVPSVWAILHEDPERATAAGVFAEIVKSPGALRRSHRDLILERYGRAKSSLLLAEASVRARSGEDFSAQVRAASNGAVPFRIRRTLSEAFSSGVAAGPPKGIPTGVRGLDELTGGLVRGWLSILLGRPGSAKTTHAVRWCAHAASLGFRGVFLSFEVKAESLSMMLGAAAIGIPFEKLWSSEGYATAAIDEMEPWDLVLDDDRHRTIESVRSLVEVEHAKKPLDFLVVDYLQKIRHTEGLPSREREVAWMANGLADIAVELNIAVLALAQAGRLPDKRANLPPYEHDIRESGVSEAAADLVIATWLEPREGELRKAKLVVRKSRYGPIGEVRLIFEGRSRVFHEEDWHEEKG